MNPIINQMHAHRSIRAYTGEVMPDSELHAAFEAAQCASTSANVQVYSVVRVTDKETLQAMIGLTGGQEKVAQCGTFLVICGDLRRHRLLARRASGECVENLESFLMCAIDTSLFSRLRRQLPQGVGEPTVKMEGWNLKHTVRSYRGATHANHPPHRHSSRRRDAPVHARPLMGPRTRCQ